MPYISENFSSICHLIHANGLEHDTIKIIVLFKNLSFKNRTMCANCVKNYGGTLGKTLSVGDVPSTARASGEAYHLCHDYPKLQDLLRQHHIHTKIELYLGQIDDFMLDSVKKRPILQKLIKITPKFSGEDMQKKADYLLWSQNHFNNPLHFGALFHTEIMTTPMNIDYKTIIYFADYERFATNRQALHHAAHQALSRRYTLIDVDVARQSALFPIDNGMDLSLAIASEYAPPFLLANKSDVQSAVDFLYKHKNITMSLQDNHGHPLFLEFNLKQIAPEQNDEFIEEFLDCLTGNNTLLNNHHVHLYKNLPQSKMIPKCRAVIYNRKILPLGLMSAHTGHYAALFHDDIAVSAMVKIADRINKILPYRYIGLDYRIITEFGKPPYFVLKSIDILKSHDLSMIGFLEKQHKNDIWHYYNALPSAHKPYFSNTIFDQITGSPLRTMLSHYARCHKM